MTRFLFASTPIEGHSATPVPIITALIAAGHEVSWLAGSAFAERAEATGAPFEPIVEADDFSSVTDPFDYFAHLRELRGAALIKAAFGDITEWSSPCEQVSSVVVYGTPGIGARDRLESWVDV